MTQRKLPSWTSEYCEGCGAKLEVEVLRSAAGYYIGQWCHEIDGPYSRLSQEYYKTEKLAQEALDKDTFTMRQNP